MTAEITDWDDAYANGAYIPGAVEYPPKWDAAAKAFRDSATHSDLNISYGDHPRQRFDLFSPGEAPKGLAVFVHGGYWLKFDKSSWSHLAKGARAHGWAVAIPGYVLAPEARLSEITQMVGAAITAAAAKVDGPICLAGHSAGGHLVSRMACRNAPLPADVASRIERVLSISGLHDLRPLLKTSMNEGLRLDATEAQTESAALCVPRATSDVVAWVGADERPEFVRQTELLKDAWDDQIRVKTVIEPSRHHFDVIEALSHPQSPITSAFISSDYSVGRLV